MSSQNGSEIWQDRHLVLPESPLALWPWTTMLTARINRNRRLGVEHELYCPVVGSGSQEDVRQRIASILSANGLRAIARRYSTDVLPGDVDVAVETDSSIHASRTYEGVQHVPLEIKTRIISYDEWESIIPKTLGLLAHLGGRMNSSCGYHVHVGLPEVFERPAVVRSVYNLFHKFELVILHGLCPPSRRAGRYSRSMPNQTKLLHGCKSLRSFKRALSHWERYYGLNLTHLWDEDPHLEVRYAGGTLNAEKARHWLRFCLQMVEHAVTRNCQAGEQVACDRDGIRKLLTTCGFRRNNRIYKDVSPELRETGRYLLLKRFRKFHLSRRSAPPPQ